VRGCLAWSKDGLQIPGAVTEATRAYRSEMDVLGAFKAQRCYIGDLAKVQAGELYKAYKKWCEDNGEHYITGTAFGRRLSEDEELDKVKDRTCTFYIGIGLLDEPKTDKDKANEPPEVNF